MSISKDIVAFSVIEPKAVMVVLLNLLFWMGIGFLLYKFIRKKKK